MTKGTLRGTNKKRIKVSGFRIRMKTTSGKRILQTRRRRKRKRIAV